MKISIRNYTLDFEKNDKKLVIQFAKQVLKQTDGNQAVEMVKQNKIFTSILEKLNESDSIKFTKDEFFSLKNMVNANHTHLKKQMAKSGFFKKFFYGSLEKQYSKILNKYFQDK
jgi:transposase-like protein